MKGPNMSTNAFIISRAYFVCFFPLTERALLMLTKWAEMEGEGATKDEITYILQGLKMTDALIGVFS